MIEVLCIKDFSYELFEEDNPIFFKGKTYKARIEEGGSYQGDENTYVFVLEENRKTTGYRFLYSNPANSWIVFEFFTKYFEDFKVTERREKLKRVQS
jgi:hypothetical protein